MAMDGPKSRPTDMGFSTPLLPSFVVITLLAAKTLSVIQFLSSFFHPPPFFLALPPQKQMSKNGVICSFHLMSAWKTLHEHLSVSSCRVQVYYFAG